MGRDRKDVSAEMKTVLVLLPVEQRHKELLEKAAPGWEFLYTPAKEVAGGQLARANVIIGNLPAYRLPQCQSLEWMQLNSAGAEAYCKPGVLDSRVVLTSSTGAYGLAISEHMIGVTLMMMKNLALYRDHQRECLWQDEGKVTSIWGSTFLILGVGDIGGEFARRVRLLGGKAIGVRRTPGACPDWLDGLYTMDWLDSLLPQADVVALCLPSTPQTAGIMDRRRLGLMKPSAYLINVGRGTAVDTEALLQALENGRLAGAALDVVEPEPLPPDHPLWACPRAVITPHAAGKFNLPETFERIVRISAENLAAYHQGRPLRNLVSRKTGY